MSITTAPRSVLADQTPLPASPVEVALAAVDEHIPEGIMEDEPLHRTIVEVMLRQYHHLYKHNNWEVTGVEEETYSPLINPDTGRRSRSFVIGGKIDVDITHKQRRHVGIIDHKTCSEDISSADSPYWQRLKVESQLSHYSLISWVRGRKIDGILWDVVRRPAIRPRQVPKKSMEEIVSTGRYYHSPRCPRVSDKTSAWVQQSLDDDEKITENLELFSIRLTALLNEDPSKYFSRRWVPRTDGELVEYSREVWQSAKSMISDRKARIHPRSPEACMRYGRPCEYLGICSGEVSEDSPKWKRDPQVHRELEEAPLQELEVLTNSRLKCDRTCQRLHYYRYELGLRKIDSEPSLALQFGQLWHAAMNAYHATFIEEEEDNGEIISGKSEDSEDETASYDHPW